MGGKLGRIMGRKVELAMVQHFFCQVLHGWNGLEVEVPEHFIGPPPSEEADDVRVHVGTEEGRGPTGACAAGRELSGVDVEQRAEGVSSRAKGPREGSGSDVGWDVWLAIESIKGGVKGSCVGS